MDSFAAKWIALVVLGCVSFILGIIPIKISSLLKWSRHGCQRSPASQLFISLLLCFGAGVLLATSLTHMLPEVKERILDIMKQNPDDIPLLFKKIPLTETLLALGFFLVYGLDELVHTVLYRRQHRQHNHYERIDVSEEEHKPGHSHCPTTTLTEREPRPSTQNSLLRQSAGQHNYGTTDCHNDHEIEMNDNENVKNVTSGLLALLALSIHSITEGLAIGLQTSTSNVFFLLLAVATHKFVIAFCLGMELSTGWGESKNISIRFHIIYMTIFSGMSALGIFIGILLTGSAPEGLFIQGLQVIAAGTLLYVTFCEVLPRERSKCHAGLAQFLAVFIGFILMLTLDSIVPHDVEEISNTTEVISTTISP